MDGKIRDLFCLTQQRRGSRNASRRDIGLLNGRDEFMLAVRDKASFRNSTLPGSVESIMPFSSWTSDSTNFQGLTLTSLK
jgi:hypothetical protein